MSTGILTQVYTCPIHGDVDGQYHEEIDTENDEIYPMMLCSRPGCHHSVEAKKTEEGVPVMREVTEDEVVTESMLEEDEWW